MATVSEIGRPNNSSELTDELLQESETVMHRNLPFAHPFAIFLLCMALTVGIQAQPAFTELISPNNRAGGGFGYESGSLPDLTGDGVGEFYVGGDRLYVYNGSSLKLLYSVTCAGGPASAGELTGDAIPDLMAWNGCSGMAGAVKFLNGTNGTVLFTLTSPNPVSDGFFGDTLRLLPDMTGDGKEDWLIHQLDLSGSGRVYIFDSATRNVVRVIQNSETASRFHMQNVEVIPDVDGDDRPELLISAFANVTRGDQTFTQAGRAIVRSLQTGEVLYELTDPDPQTGGWFGFALSSAGDITGDKIGDIAVGTFTKDDYTGVIYLFSGKDGQWLRTVRSPIPGTSGRFGRKIELLPDLNGDGVPELWTQEDGFHLTHWFDGATSKLLQSIEYPGSPGKLFFISTVRQATPPGMRAYLFASEFAGDSNEGRAYYMPFVPIVKTKPPQLKPRRTSDSGFRLQVMGEPGTKAEIQRTRDFKTWQPIGSVTFGTEAAEVDDLAVPSRSHSFYRAVQGP